MVVFRVASFQPIERVNEARKDGAKTEPVKVRSTRIIA